MLLLNEPSLLDNLVESIGDPTPPGVRLTDLDGRPDQLLVELIAEHWNTLLPHLGQNPLLRLTDSRPKPDADDNRVLQALSAAAAFPAIADMLTTRIAAELAADGTSPTQTMLRVTPTGIDYLIAQEGRSATNFRRVLAVAESDTAAYGDRASAVAQWALAHLLEPWDIPHSELEGLLLEATDLPLPERRPSRRPPGGSIARSAHIMRFPSSKPAQDYLAHIENWFAQPAEDREDASPLTWLEATTLALTAAPANQLPHHLEQLLHPRRLELAREPMWKFTTPLLHRLNTDGSAVEVLAKSLNGTSPTAPNTLLPDPAPQMSTAEDVVARRVFLAARALRAAGRLTPDELATALEVLRTADPRLVVTDPFADSCGPLRTLGASLLDGLTT
jgi:hypothetical protein